MSTEDKEKLWVKIIHFGVQCTCVGVSFAATLMNNKANKDTQIICLVGTLVLLFYAVMCLKDHIDDIHRKSKWW